MPINNSIAKLFELEDILLQDITTTNDEVHISFPYSAKLTHAHFATH